MPSAPLSFSYSLDNIDEAAARLWNYGRHIRVWTLQGSMGAGKTTLVRSLCTLAGVRDRISSPTFALVNEYHTARNSEVPVIYHMDWYRLRGPEEAIGAGIEDLLSGGRHCFVEWPEIASGLLPAQRLEIEISLLTDSERSITARITQD